MTALGSALRLGAKAVAWVVLAIAGLFAMLIVGWVPPELAATLGSARGGGREHGEWSPGSADTPPESQSPS